jgi:hypothetical protein
MHALLLPLLLAVGVEEEKTVHRYLKPAGEKFVLESEVTITKSKSHSLYVSRTVRGNETMILRVKRDMAGQFLQAEIEHQKGEVKKTAHVEPKEGKLRVTRDSGIEDVAVRNPVIFTTAPDWSDIFEMAARFDPKREDKQEFAGLWFHPTLPSRTPKFSIERLGTDKITAFGKEHVLARCRARLRGGSSYLVWVFADGRVCKILPGGEKAIPVVLEGFDNATRGLK